MNLRSLDSVGQITPNAIRAGKDHSFLPRRAASAQRKIRHDSAQPALVYRRAPPAVGIAGLDQPVQRVHIAALDHTAQPQSP